MDHFKGRPYETVFETLVRKAYPLVNRLRNPMRHTVNRRPTVVHHGGKSDHYFAIYQCFYKQQYELPVPLFSPDFHATAVNA